MNIVQKMGSVADPGEISHPPSPPPSFDEFQRQTSLMTSCTLLWKELSDHFTSLEQNLEKKSAALRSKMENFDSQTKFSLEILEERESTLSDSLALALKQLEKSKSEALSTISATDKVEIEENSEPEVDNSVGLFFKLKTLCAKMDSRRFWGFVILRKKEIEKLRMEVPRALGECVDPPKLVLEAISEVFPVDNRKVEGGGLIGHDLGWACVLLLESLVPVMEDPVIGKKRMLVTPSVKEKAEEIAETWKRSLDERGGAENVKTPDVHTFLQHLVTFGIVKVEDLDLYRKLVVASAWRKQMPKLAVSLGLGDKMADMIEELISRGQHVDAVHFTYEVGLADKFPPIPLLKDFLKDAKKAIASILEDPSNSGRAQQIASKKEQSALRAVIRCIEEYKLENEFPSESLKKRLEQLEKVKIEKKKPIAAPPSPANKRTRANSGGPMPPAKAGRLANAYVSSFPSTPAFVRSPPSQTQYTAAVPQYASPPYSSPPQAMYGHGGRSPPYAYSPEAYAGSPVSYQAYGGYANGIPAAYPTAYY